jgi:hypothetical protein
VSRNHFRKYKLWTVEDPEVLAIITGVTRFAQNGYYKIIDGVHTRFPVNGKLIAGLPTTACAASKLLTAAQEAGIIRWGEYTPPYKLPKPPKPKKEKPEPRAKAVIRSKVKPRTIEPEPEPELSGRQRFCLVQRGEFHGIFYQDSGRVEIISRERSDAVSVLRRLLKPERGIYKPPVDQIYDRAHPEPEPET